MARCLIRVLLGNAIVGFEMPFLGGLDGGTVLQFVAELGVEAVLIGHILNGTNLVLRIHIGKGTTDHTRSVRHFGVLAIHMAGSPTCLVAEHIRTGWNFRFRGDQMGDICPGSRHQANDLEARSGRYVVE